MIILKNWWIFKFLNIKYNDYLKTYYCNNKFLIKLKLKYIIIEFSFLSETYFLKYLTIYIFNIDMYCIKKNVEYKSVW